jgi:adenylate cyclase
VLPFANMSGDAEQEYFSDGISEDITTDLSKVSALAVTARNTAFTFKGHSVDVADVARKLGVSHVLEGSVRKAGLRVRITAQLIDGASGDHLWAERYDRDLTDIFAIQDELSKAIVDALKVRLLPAEKQAITQRGTNNADAYNLYLMARKYWVSGNYGDIGREQRVIRLCRRSVEIDPDYAQAWALMALAQASLRFYCDMIDGDAGASAERALSIDPTIAEAYAVRGRLLAEDDQFEEANHQIARALELGPDSWEVNREAARVSMTQSRIAEAMRFYEKAVEIIESDYHSWAMLVMCHQALGNHDELLRGAEMMVSESAKALAEDPSNGAALGIHAGGHAILGNRDLAMETIERALLINPENLNMRYNFACVLSAYLNERDAALALLEPVFASGPWIVKSALIDPDLQCIKDDPRFQKMLEAARRRLNTQGDR